MLRLSFFSCLLKVLFTGLQMFDYSIICSIELAGEVPHSEGNFNGCLWLGYLKVTITLMKYFPQALKNYKRKLSSSLIKEIQLLQTLRIIKILQSKQNYLMLGQK